MTTHPPITIGITAYNAHETVERAIRSALEQDWPNKQIIVVDDASADGTAQIVEKIAKDHSLLFIKHDCNRGVASARNTILQNAKCAFIAFFDDDDTSDPQRLRLQYEAIINAEKRIGQKVLMLCHTARKQIYPNMRVHHEPPPGIDQGTAPPGGEGMALRILCGKPLRGGFGSMATCSQMARRETYEQLGGFDERFRRAEDTDLAVRAALAGGCFVGVAQAAVTQTMTHGNDKQLSAEAQAQIQLYEKHRSFITRHMPYDFVLGWTHARFHYLKRQRWLFYKTLLHLFFRYPRLCLQKVFWAMPNHRFRQRAREFHA